MCTFLIRCTQGIRGYCAINRQKRQLNDLLRTLVSKTREILQSGINLDKSAHKHRKGQKRHLQHANDAHFATDGNERRGVGPNTEQIGCKRVYVIHTLRLHLFMERSRRGHGGIGAVAVRSNKGLAVSLLFRHSVMTVIEKGRVFPPHLTQL